MINWSNLVHSNKKKPKSDLFWDKIGIYKIISGNFLWINYESYCGESKMKIALSDPLYETFELSPRYALINKGESYRRLLSLS